MSRDGKSVQNWENDDATEDFLNWPPHISPKAIMA